MSLFNSFNQVTAKAWKSKIIEDLKGKDFDKTLVWNSAEGIAVQPFYNSESLPHNFTTPLKKSTHWKIRESITIKSIKKANQQALIALKGGANSIVFIGEIKNQNEMDVLLKDIQLALIEVHFYNSTPLKTTHLIIPKQGAISFDYLGEFYTTGHWQTTQENDINELATLTTSTPAHIKTITINGNNFSNNIICQLAFSLNQGVEYLNLLTDKKIDASTIADKMQFTLSIGTNYFFEIAKIRAARLLWNLILKQYKINDGYMTIHSQTLSTQQSNNNPEFNMLSNTTKAMSAIIGGCDSLTIFPHDNKASTINFSNRIARNIQHILKEEAFFDKAKNPADGAYYIETLTQEIAKKAWKLFQVMEQQGGFLAGVKNGFIKNELNQAANAE